MEEEIEEEKQNNNMKIVGINLAILAGYTTLSAVISGGPIIDAFFLVCHVFACLIMALSNRKWIWALSGLVVLLIGVSTCFGVIWRIQGSL